MDSTGISGLSGFLETQLATAAPPATPSVTATISAVSTDGVLGPVTINSGDVSGSFSSTPLTLGNDNGAAPITGLSDLQQQFSYGTNLSFVLTLSGSEVKSGDPSTPFTGTLFTFILEDANQNGLNSGPFYPGEAFNVMVGPNGGSVMVTPNDPYVAGGPVPGFVPAAAGDPTVTIAPFSVPEPSSIMLLGLGTLIVFGRYYRLRSA